MIDNESFTVVIDNESFTVMIDNEVYHLLVKNNIRGGEGRGVNREGGLIEDLRYIRCYKQQTRALKNC